MGGPMTFGNTTTDAPPRSAPRTGDFLIARGKSWIVEKTELSGPVETLHLVSCEDDSQGESLQLALEAELQTQVVDPTIGRPC